MQSCVWVLPRKWLKVLSAMSDLNKVFTDVTVVDIFDYLQRVDPGNQLSLTYIGVSLTTLKNWKLVTTNGWTSALRYCYPNSRSRLVYVMTDEGRRRLEMALQYEQRINADEERLYA